MKLANADHLLIELNPTCQSLLTVDAIIMADYSPPKSVIIQIGSQFKPMKPAKSRGFNYNCWYKSILPFLFKKIKSIKI